ncbi:serine hydrolase [Leuconostoc pseudomesenteroides]|uniref:serine hydrolase n=1 Tax=Leuconostoc pseudomesenteroides TaxID=33968 RepID=UPI002285F784|nr:serine hydrolase [Leuconostoc pseudomesenteroides]WAM38698.1 serine hydrolase [Leuconostoc pseudomesenteroides]
MRKILIIFLASSFIVTTASASTIQNPTISWKKVIKKTDGDATVIASIRDLSTGKTYTYRNSKTKKIMMASTIKVSILEALMIQKQNAGETLTADEKENATQMITNSDNDAATALWTEIGGDDGLNNFWHSIDVKITQATYFGETMATASQQNKILDQLYNKNSLLNTTSKSYILSLMSNISDTQDWGVSTGAKDVALKNGWMTDYNADNGTWIVNSSGIIDDKYILTIYTTGNSDYQTGVTLVNKLSKAANKQQNKKATTPTSIWDRIKALLV